MSKLIFRLWILLLYSGTPTSLTRQMHPWRKLSISKMLSSAHAFTLDPRVYIYIFILSFGNNKLFVWCLKTEKILHTFVFFCERLLRNLVWIWHFILFELGFKRGVLVKGELIFRLTCLTETNLIKFAFKTAQRERALIKDKQFIFYSL